MTIWGQVISHLGRRRAATALAVGLLALGVGLSVSFFSVLDGALLGGLPFPGGDRLVAFSTQDAAGWPMPLDDYREIEAAQLTFEWTLPFRTFNTMVTRGDRTKGVIGGYVPAALFERLGVKPVIGRAFTAEDEDPGSPPVALISHRLWQASYGADPEIVGEEITLNREPSVVVGVMPPGFRFPLRHDVWGVFGRHGREWQDFFVLGMGKLASESTLSLARKDLSRIGAILDEARPRPEGRTPTIESFARANIGDQAQGALRAMVFAALGLLALACANLANLRLSESLRRTSEFDTRLALGSGLPGLVKLLLLENLVLGIASAMMGLVLAFVVIETLGRSLIAGGYLERIFWIDPQLDLRAASFAVVCALVAAQLGALAPVLTTVSRIRAGGFGRAGDSRTRTAAWSRSLVSLQVGLCFALLVGAGLWSLKAFELMRREPGFNLENLSSVSLSVYQAQLDEPEQRRALFERLKRELDEHPGVLAAAYASSSPWGYVPALPVAGATRVPDRKTAPRAQVLEVSSDFFATLELNLQAGRAFGTAESSDSEVAIVSRSLADQMFQKGALDQTLTIGGKRSDDPVRRPRIVGIAADLDVGHSADRNRNLTVYLPAGVPEFGAFVLIRRQQGMASARPLVEGVLERVAPLVGILDELSVAKSMSSSTWVERRLGQIFSLFAIAAWLLTVGGIYAVIAVMVRSRERELGIRAALGAKPSDLQRLVLNESGRQLACGIVVGFGLLWIGGRVLDRVLVEGIQIRVDVLAVSAAVVALSALGGSLGPTRKAARADPARCLSVR